MEASVSSLGPEQFGGSPKLNGSVERAQRTHTEEFYEVAEFSLKIRAHNEELKTWEQIYNTVRPHQAFGYLTPSSS